MKTLARCAVVDRLSSAVVSERSGNMEVHSGKGGRKGGDDVRAGGKRAEYRTSAERWSLLMGNMEKGRDQGSGSRAHKMAGASIGQTVDRSLRMAMIARCREDWGGRGGKIQSGRRARQQRSDGSAAPLSLAPSGTADAVQIPRRITELSRCSA